MTQPLVVDNSVVMRWFHPMGTQADLAYADKVLEQLEAGDLQPLSPEIFLMEFPNVLHELQRRKQLQGSVEAALLHWENLGFLIVRREREASLYMHTLSNLCAEYALTAYDAAYLELALRKGYPLLTLDKALRKAATKAGVNCAFTI